MKYFTQYFISNFLKKSRLISIIFITITYIIDIITTLL